MSSIWLSDDYAAKNNVRFLTDPTHPLIRREMEQQQRELGLRCDSALSEAQRRDFDRAMVAKYGDRYPPPARTQWVLLGWEVVEQAVANGIIKDG